PSPPPRARRFPILLNRWLDAHPQALASRARDLETWIRRNLSGPTMDRVEVALHLGSLLGLDDLVIEHFSLQAYKLFNAGRFDLINRITGKYLAQDRPLPHYFYVIAARTMARQDRFDEAIAVVERGKAIYEERDHAEVECGELAFVAGNVFRFMNRTNEAMTELFLAREFFQVARDQRRLATADCSLGNLYFGRGSPREARRHYLSALGVMKSLGERDGQASLLGNLGLVEYDCGRFRRAALFLGQAVSLHKSLKNTWNQAIAQLSLSKVYLKMGQFSKAIRVLKECHQHKVQQRHESGVLEAAALLAWVCELLGNPAAAKAWWDQIPDLAGRTLEPRAVFVINGVRAMTALFKGEFAEAEKRYAAMLASSRKGNGSDIEGGDCLHGIGVSQALRGDPRAADTLLEAERQFAPFPQRSQTSQIRLFGALFFPDRFPHVQIDEQVRIFLDSQAYEPFWALFAGHLQRRGTPGCLQFLEYHLRKTPSTMLQGMLARQRALAGVIQHVEARRLRAAEFYLCLENGLTRPIHVDDYQAWRGKYPRQHLVFDGPSGILAWHDHTAYLRPGSIPHGVVTQLLIAFPHPVDVDALYHAVWKTPFDPETDTGAFKSSLQRLQKILRSVTPTAKIRRKKTKSKFGGIALLLSCHWEAIL
ncbi:MAG: tetratricopeptide repeat protein, partial [Candidatus Riflebacteria bacterium]|nr:tetratricopeptide repeat protein [Candidatus Riflebacteria bacterium]